MYTEVERMIEKSGCKQPLIMNPIKLLKVKQKQYESLTPRNYQSIDKAKQTIDHINLEQFQQKLLNVQSNQFKDQLSLKSCSTTSSKKRIIWKNLKGEIIDQPNSTLYQYQKLSQERLSSLDKKSQQASQDEIPIFEKKTKLKLQRSHSQPKFQTNINSQQNIAAYKEYEEKINSQIKDKLQFSIKRDNKKSFDILNGNVQDVKQQTDLKSSQQISQNEKVSEILEMNKLEIDNFQLSNSPQHSDQQCQKISSNTCNSNTNNNNISNNQPDQVNNNKVGEKSNNDCVTKNIISEDQQLMLANCSTDKFQSNLEQILSKLIDTNPDYFDHKSGRCVCKYCTCGHCEIYCNLVNNKLKSKIDLSWKSSYQKDFQDTLNQVSKPPVFNSRYYENFHAQLPGSFDTTNQIDYQQPAVENQGSNKRIFVKSTDPFFGVTSYNLQFKKSDISIPEKMKFIHDRTVLPNLPFFGKTTYSDSFFNFLDKCERQRSLRPNNLCPLPNNGLFCGESSNRKFFPKLTNEQLILSQQYKPSKEQPEAIPGYDGQFLSQQKKDYINKIILCKGQDMLRERFIKQLEQLKAENEKNNTNKIQLQQ